MIKSKQNTSKTDGYSVGGNIGIPIGPGVVSVNTNTSQTDGNRTFVGNQSSFVVGENSNLKIKNVTNEAGIIGTNGQNSNIKIENYVGKNIENIEKLTTTGVSGGTGGVGVNYSNSEKEGITRNIVIGNIEIEKSSGDTINTDLNKANEITKDSQSSTNINVESQTIEYATNPAKFKEDVAKAKQEIDEVKRAFNESINDRGDDNRNFFGQLSEARLTETIDNIAGSRLERATTDNQIAGAFKDAYRDLGYDNVDILFSDPKNAPQLIDKDGKPKAGTAFVSDETGRRTIIINAEAAVNHTRAGLIGTIAEEGSHIIGAVEGRQLVTGTDEKGLESTGKASNAYLTEKYGKNDENITINFDGNSYVGVDFGEHVGDTGGACLGGKLLEECLKRNQNFIKDYHSIDSKTAKKIDSFVLDFTPGVGTLKGVIEGVMGKDVLTGEDLNLLTRVLSIIPIARPAFKGTKKLIKIFKIAGKKQVVLTDGTKIMLNLDEVTKFEKEAKNIAKTSNVLKDLKSETIMKRFNATIDSGNKGKGFKVNGDYRMALREFYSLNPKNVRRVPKPAGEEMFIGTIDVGGKEVTINVRNYSSKLSENNPTLELLEKGKKNSKKIRYVK